MGRSNEPVSKPTPEVLNPVTRKMVGEAKLGTGQTASSVKENPIPKIIAP